MCTRQSGVTLSWCRLLVDGLLMTGCMRGCIPVCMPYMHVDLHDMAMIGLWIRYSLLLYGIWWSGRIGVADTAPFLPLSCLLSATRKRQERSRQCSGTRPSAYLRSRKYLTLPEEQRINYSEVPCEYICVIVMIDGIAIIYHQSSQKSGSPKVGCSSPGAGSAPGLIIPVQTWKSVIRFREKRCPQGRSSRWWQRSDWYVNGTGRAVGLIMSQSCREMPGHYDTVGKYHNCHLSWGIQEVVCSNPGKGTRGVLLRHGRGVESVATTRLRRRWLQGRT